MFAGFPDKLAEESTARTYEQRLFFNNCWIINSIAGISENSITPRRKYRIDSQVTENGTISEKILSNSSLKAKGEKTKLLQASDIFCGSFVS